jgi:hypothetical protein
MNYDQCEPGFSFLELARLYNMGGGGAGFRIVGFHRKKFSDFGSGEYFTTLDSIAFSK